MKKLIRELMVLGVIGVVSAGAFGQGKPRDDNRPVKKPEKVVSPDKDKRQPPPPQNDKKPKPDNKKKPN